MPSIDYEKQRAKVTPPHISISGLRIRIGLKQEDVRRKVEVILGKSFTPGAMSAIENGHRGASAEVLGALETAMGLRPGDLVTNYEPGHVRRRLAESA